jgi:hypothetical protein
VYSDATTMALRVGDGIEQVEARTRDWLNDRLTEGLTGSKDDFLFNLSSARPQRMSLYWFQRFQRQLKIFRWLEGMRFESFLDVGSGIEHYPLHAHARYGCESYYTDLQPSFVHPRDGAWSGKQDHAVVSNVRRLPFPDAAFDVVVCTEVLEHLVRPVEAIAELMRVARRYVILTSLEAWEGDDRRRRAAHSQIDVDQPHVERNFLAPEEFRALFGAPCHFECLFQPATMPASPFDPPEVISRAYGGLLDPDALVARLAASVRDGSMGDATMGVMLVKTLDGPAPTPPVAERDAELARWILERAAYVERSIAFTLLGYRDGHLPAPDPAAPVSGALIARSRCPDCHGGLENAAAEIHCRQCGESFSSEYGVPLLTPQRPIDDAAAERRAIDRLCGADERRAAIVRALSRRLRENEAKPGLLRRLLRSVRTSGAG